MGTLGPETTSDRHHYIIWEASAPDCKYVEYSGSPGEAFRQHIKGKTLPDGARYVMQQAGRPNLTFVNVSYDYKFTHDPKYGYEFAHDPKDKKDEEVE